MLAEVSVKYWWKCWQYFLNEVLILVLAMLSKSIVYAALPKFNVNHNPGNFE